MTEDDAMGLICPTSQDGKKTCLGADCIAWVWIGRPGYDEKWLEPNDRMSPGSGWERTVSKNAAGQVRWIRENVDAPGNGDCRLLRPA